MRILFGYDISYDCAGGVPMVVMLRARPSSDQRLLSPDDLCLDPYVPSQVFTDGFGNIGTRFLSPAGRLRMRAQGVLADSGVAERAVYDAAEIPIARLPFDAMQFLLASRYCETDLLMSEAWRLFGGVPAGWSRVQAISDFVRRHVTFGYQFARPTRTAFETYRERQGVCRDFAHLAIAFCRCLNIPARYCTSYLGDIGVPAVDAPMDFAASMEVYLGDAWHSFDPRNGARRIGRILIARGRDAADVALSTSFGCATLQSFQVHTEEISERSTLELLRNPLSFAA